MLQIGSKVERSRQITHEDITAFNEATGSQQRIDWVDGKERPMVESMFAAGLIAELLAEEIPGEQKVYLSQSLKFLAMIYVGDEITARATVTYYRDGELQLNLACYNQSEMLILTGEAIILVDDD